MKADASSAYSIYRNIKDRLSTATRDQTVLLKPCAALLANILYDKRSTRKRLRKAFKLLWLTPLYSELGRVKGNLVSWNVQREDHRQSAEDMCAALGGGGFRLAYVADIDKDCTKILDFAAIGKAVGIAMRCKQGLVYTIYLVCTLTYTIKSIKRLKDTGIVQNINTLVCYNSSNVPECFVAAACKEKGIKTFSLQHGFYYRFMKEPPLAVINYENVVADKLLVWSEFCKEQIEEFHEAEKRTPDYSLSIAGYFKTSQAKPRPASSEPPRSSQVVLCLLPGPDDLATSLMLLAVLSTLPGDYQIVVRTHPLLAHATIMDALPAGSLLDGNRLLADTLAQYPFQLAIGFNSTSLIETLLADIPCAIFKTRANTLPAMPLDTFQDAEGLEKLIKQRKAGLSHRNRNYLLGADMFEYANIINPSTIN